MGYVPCGVDASHSRKFCLVGSDDLAEGAIVYCAAELFGK